MLIVVQLVYAVQAVRAEPIALRQPTLLAQSFALFVLGYLLQLMAWVAVMRSLNARIGLSFAFQGYYLSFLPRYLPGSVWGYFGRGEWLWTQQQIPYRTTNIGSVFEALFFLISAGIWVAIDWSGSSSWGWALAGGLALCWGVVWWVGKRQIRHMSPARNYTSWLWLLGAGVVYLVYWWAQGLALSAMLRSLGIVATNATVLSLTSSAALAWSVGFLIIFVPSGLGVREVSLAYLLATHSGISAHDASLIAVISRAAMIVAEICLLALALLYNIRTSDHAHSESGGL